VNQSSLANVIKRIFVVGEYNRTRVFFELNEIILGPFPVTKVFFGGVARTLLLLPYYTVNLSLDNFTRVSIYFSNKNQL
jgi:hypothetical protein